MPALTWIASYPKSGNTWIRILLANYLRDEPVSGMISLQETAPDFATLFRAGRELPIADHPWPLFAKTHFLPGVEVKQPYRMDTTKVVYIVRNPRDVLLSASRFLHVAPEHLTAFGLHFVEHRGVEDWARTGWGTWPEHVREWSDPEILGKYFPRAEVLVVRYEDLRQDTVKELTRIVGFLGYAQDDDPDRVARAVGNSTLDKLREVERLDESPGTKAYRRNSETSFFGAGLSGQSLAGIGEEVEEAYRRLLREDEDFAGRAALFGYLD